MPETALESSRLFVLDTNVLMHDPTALFRFKEHDIFLPMVSSPEGDALVHRDIAEESIDDGLFVLRVVGSV